VVLIQLLLPTKAETPNGWQDTAAELAETRRELLQTFDGLTAYVRSPAKGSWTAPDGHTEQDDVVMVEVVARGFDQIWWRSYAKILSVRFRQEVIHVRSIAIETI
jgi:hypothetical protein